MPKRLYQRLYALGMLIGLAATSAVRGAEPFEFYPNGVYKKEIPTIASVLGYDIGERMTSYAGIEKYIQALARASDRVRLYPYGESYEKRTLYYLAIGTPEHLARLDTIKANIAKLADPRTLRSDEEAEAIIKSNPLIVWLSYGVHGNEHSSSEAALQTAYQLAAGTDPVTQQILESTVVLIDPVQNPDGRERFISYYYSVAGPKPNPDPNAAEHREGWPSGRFNHYLFDLNRDWFFLTQRETVARVKTFLDWRPQVFVDLHEMDGNSTYYFAPPAPPINNNFPEVVRKWWAIYGRGNAEAFDRFGFDYYTKEVYDSFYPGYGDSWPSLNGAIGMTYEQASVRGLVLRRNDDTLLTLRDAAWHHFTASIATCKTAAAHREAQLRDYYHFFKTALKEGTEGDLKEIMLLGGTDNWKAAKLVTVLMSQGIEVRQAEAGFSSTRVQNFVDNRVERKSFPAGTYIIPLQQPKKRLIQALFEKEARLDEKFVREEIERRKNKIPNRFYDVTAWSIPLAYGVEAYWTDEPARVPSTILREPPRPAGRVVNAPAGYAYLLKYDANEATRAAYQLLAEDYRVRVAKESFKLNGEAFAQGTLIVRVHTNKPELHDRVAALARACGVTFYGVNTGWTEEGINLGSGNVLYLKKPRIAVAFAEPTAPMSYGWIAYLLEQRYGMDFTPIRTASIPTLDFRDYNILILPDGTPDGYRHTLGEKGAARLKEWVRNGGVLVALKGAAAFATQKGIDWTSATLVTDLRKLRKESDRNPTGATGIGTDKREGVANKEEETGDAESPDPVPGAILRARLDSSHFLTFGYDGFTNVLMQSSYIFTPSKTGINVATFVPDEKELRVSGFLWEKMQKALPRQAYLWDEPLERGHIILFADDPNFRAYWDGLNRLLLNAVLFGPSLRR